MAKGKVLAIGSNATRIEVRGGGTGATGQYLNETVVPAQALIAAGYDVVLATPNGTKPHIDEASRSAQHFEGDEAAFQRAEAFYANDPSMNQVRTLRSVIDEGLDNYAAVFVPGGQAPMVDLMQDADVGEILRFFHARRKPRRCCAMVRSLSPRRCLPRANFVRRSSPATRPRRRSSPRDGRMRDTR